MRRGPILVAGLGLVLGTAAPAAAPIVYRNRVHTDAGDFELETTKMDAASEAALTRARRTRNPRPTVDELLESSRADPQQLLQFRLALASAGSALATWGKLKVPVHVVVVQSHAALESAANHPGFDWLRAWARYDDVTVQAPETWAAAAPEQHAINELVTHELTHCLMFQRIAGPDDWYQRRIPLWFREGMASWTAKQEYRWLPLESLAQFYDAHPKLDPVTDGEDLYKDRSDAVYAAAHHAFAFLVRRYGEDSVRKLLDGLGPAYVGFPEAFLAAVGISVDAFVKDFERYVKLRGFHPAEKRR